MQAKAYFDISEYNEESEKLGLPEPKPIVKLLDFYFNKTYLEAMWLTTKGDIQLVLLGNGVFRVAHDKQLYNELKEYLNKK